jgi:REP element-mobilizing transposase RayT
MNTATIEEYYPDFITITCYEWKHVLKEDIYKYIIVDSLSFLVKVNRIKVYAFVMMSNHFHIIWQIQKGNKREDVQRDFLKYTAQQLLKRKRKENAILLQELLVNLKDRKYQIWQRNSLSIELRSKKVFQQKLADIHNNSVKAGLCILPEEYKYSSAKFYELKIID